MRARASVLLCVLTLASTLVACGDDDGPGPVDSGRPDMAAVDLGQDATAPDGSVADVGPMPDSAPGDDTGPVDDSGPIEDATPGDDTGPDDDAGPASDSGPTPDSGPSPDAGPSNTCEAGGGECVPVVPDACASGVIGDAREYSCGGGLGVMCCLPDRPVCTRIGTREEGWYLLDGTMICAASCAGAAATCDAIGTRSEGWYAPRDDQGCMLGRLIVWDDCG